MSYTDIILWNNKNKYIIKKICFTEKCRVDLFVYRGFLYDEEWKAD